MIRRRGRFAAAEALSIGLFAFFSAAVLHSALSNPFVFDPAIHAIVAKNVASGYGWAMSYHTRDLLLPITTGPVMILPCAAMVAAFGNTIWVPPLTAGLINVSLLGVFLYRLRRLVEDRWVMLAVTAGVLGVLVHFHTEWWTTFVGEIASLLLFLIACTIAVDERIASEPRRVFVVGVVAGLTILTRMLALPGFVGIGLYLLATALRGHGRSATALTRLLLCGVAGVVVTVTPFRIYEAAQLWQSADYTYADQLAFNRDIFWSNSAIGVGRLLTSATPLTDMARNAVRNTRTMVQVFASYGITAAALGLSVGVTLALLWSTARRRAPASPLDRFVAVLGVSLATYLSWFLLALSGAALTDRYTLQPMLLFLCLLVVLAARRFPRAGVPILLLAVAVSAPPTRAAVTRDILLFRPAPWFGGRSAEYNDQVLDATAFIATGRFRYPLANCGWMGTTRELEFLLPAVNNFKDCYQVIEEALESIPAAAGADSLADERPAGTTDGGDAVRRDRYRWKHPVSFTLVINNVTWALAEHYGPNKVRHDVLARACNPRPLYETELYRIVECDFAGLERHVPLDASTPFVGTPPMWKQSSGDASPPTPAIAG